MKTTINTKKICGCLGAIVFLAALSTSCKIPSADSISAPPAGTINVKFGAASTSSTSKRTAVPDLAANAAVYVITCANAATGTSSAAEISGTTTYEFTNIVPGNVTVSVSAYSSSTTKDSTTLIASGSSSITLGPGEGANVTVQLAMVASGSTGGFSLNIQWPTALATSVDWKLDSNAKTAPTITASNGTSSATIAASSISAGSHALTILFKNGTTTVGMAIETVNVYANLTSTKWVDSNGNLVDTRTFTTNDFTSSGTDLSLRITTVSNSYTMTFSSSKTSDAIWVPSGTTNIMLIPTEGTTGQTLSYTWNGGAVTNATSGDLQTLGYPGSATNFVVTVTDPAGSSSRTYTLTVNPATAITDAAGLTGMSLTGNYVLTADIDLKGITWPQIGTETDPATTGFIGTFDGGGHTVNNLSINISNCNAGFFGVVGPGAVISNIRLKNVYVNGGSSGDGVGGLVGENYGGTITRCSVSGSVSGEQAVGGLVGNNRGPGKISECYSTAMVRAINKYSGGLVGSNWGGTITDCYAESIVSDCNFSAGLVGSEDSSGQIVNCYSTSCVFTAVPVSPKYGMIGGNTLVGTCTSCYFDASISGLSDFFGTATTTGNLKQQSTYSGWNFDSIWAIDPSKNNGYPYLRNVISTEIAIASQADLEAINANPSGDYYLTSDITISGVWTFITASGGISGTFNGNNHTITNTTTGSNGLFGFIGTTGRVTNLHVNYPNFTSSVDDNCIGGICTFNSGLVFHCSVSGRIQGTYPYTGALVGSNYSGTISECYSTATVSGTSQVGGISGDNNGGKIVNCYNRGSVSASGSKIGGITGENIGSSAIISCYSTGVITSASAAPGGIVENSSGGTVSYCYYDSDTSGQVDATNGTGISDGNMKIESTFTAGGWDFTNLWGISGSINNGYPYLKYFGSNTVAP